MKTHRFAYWAAALFLSTWIFLNMFSARAAVPTGDLAIIELKPTDSESVVIENISNSTLNLQNYLVQYFNSRSPSNFNTPTSVQALPNFNLTSGQSFLLSGNSDATCGAAGVANLSMSLSDTSGYIQVAKVTQQSGSTLYTAQDHVNWTSGSTAPTDITQVPSASSDENAVYYRLLSEGSWHKYEKDTTPCNLLVAITASPQTTFTDWASGAAAPATIISTSTSSAGIPANDVGLAGPQITELLPNPASPQTDADDEFIELYNPNDSAFDLSGFSIEIGLTTKHDYTFENGTTLPAKSFAVFYSSDTGLNLSNSGGEVWLLDPAGKIVSQTDVYSSAKDGLAWAFAAGKWYWTSTPTPNAANLINGVSLGGSQKSKTKTTPAVEAASTTSGSSGSGSVSAGSTGSTPATAPVHTWTLAAVGSAAVLYAAYEYRADLANHLYKLQQYRAARAASGQSIIPAGLRGAGQRLGGWQNHLRSRLGRRLKK